MLRSKSEVVTIYSGGLHYTEILTDRIQSLVSTSGVATGLVNAVLQHTTGALLLVEHEAGIFLDLRTALENLAPGAGPYKHHDRGVDTNGASHVLSAMLNKTVTIPIVDGAALLGTYQEIIFMDFQSEAVERDVSVLVFGEGP